MPPRVSVIIPNWNGKRYLGPCLDALLEQSFTDFEIVVVDNGSKDGSVSFLKQNYPDIHVIELPENCGFAAAANAGIYHARSEYIALLNNDTQPTLIWLEALVSALDDVPDHVGSASSRVLSMRVPHLIDGIGIWISDTGQICQIGWRQPDGPSFDNPRYVFGPVASAALYKRAVFEDVGPFDVDFQSYYEDADLAWRAHKAGWKSLYVPEAVVYHWGSATGGSFPTWKRALQHRNFIFCMIKNANWPIALRVFFEGLMKTTAFLLLALVQGRIDDVRLWLRCQADLVQKLPGMIRKRQLHAERS